MRLGSRVNRLPPILLVAVGALLLLPPPTAFGQSGTTWYDPDRQVSGSVTVRPDAGGLLSVTRIDGPQASGNRQGQIAQAGGVSQGTAAGTAAGTVDSRFTYGPCSFVEGVGQNWWQSAISDYSYG